MNDHQIRNNFHKKVLEHEHNCLNTLVIDELGLKHGTCRADIAVINKYINGFEIKSSKDSLFRLKEQMNTYNSIFDYINLIIEPCHLVSVEKIIPDWWGIIICVLDNYNEVIFEEIKTPKKNDHIDPISIAELLWKNEAEDILNKNGFLPKILRKPKAFLYQYIIDILSLDELKNEVKYYLLNRQNWRCPV